jgi:hypothetical protein
MKTNQALQLVNQAIQSHPDDWQAYQMRSIVHPSQKLGAHYLLGPDYPDIALAKTDMTDLEHRLA